MKPCVKFSVMLAVWAMFFSLKWIVAVGIAVILHELAHLAACKALGIEVFGMKALPWGLTAATPLMHDPLSQLVVSISGPMMNFFLLSLCPLIEKAFSQSTAELFALANLADGLLNLIPALPLDGGIILKAFLCAKCGFVKGFEHMIKITVLVSLILMLAGIHVITLSEGNFSYLIAGAFMLFNLKHEKELVICLKKRILTGEIKSKPSKKRIYAQSSSHAICLVDLISPAYTIVVCITENGKERATLTQNKLLECVLKNSGITLGECIEKK